MLEHHERLAELETDHDGLDAAGVLKVSQISQGRERLKKASHQTVHAFMFDCNTCLTHHSIFIGRNPQAVPPARAGRVPLEMAPDLPKGREAQEEQTRG